MKEYLEKNESGNYVLISAYRKEGNDWIEVPDGAEVFMDGFNTNRGYAFYKDNFDMVHGDNRYWEECRKADISKNAVVRWQREPKYKEFLNANDNYNLVMLPEHAGDDERSGLIQVPDGADFAYKAKEVIFTTRDTGSYLGQLVWQRYTQPESLPFVDDEAQSINDQYAEIEQVRQQSIDATLAERQSTYGSFEDVAFVTENIINVLKKCNYDYMPHTHKMAMYMIASKMARLVSGDCNHLDSWHDIQGYAKLVEKIIEP